jgi:hypothetical protein
MEPKRKKQKVYDNNTNTAYCLANCPTDIMRVIVNGVQDFVSVSNLSLVCKKLHIINCTTLLEKCIIDHDTGVQLTESLTRSISTLTQLVTLYITDYTSKKLRKEFLLQLTTLSQLQKLRLYGNKINVDDVDDLFIHLSKLQYLALSNAKSFSVEWLLFSHLTKLKRLKLVCCSQVHGLGTLLGLEVLVLRKSALESEDYCDLNSMHFLTCFKYDHNLSPKDEHFEMMYGLTSLKELVVRHESTGLSMQAVEYVLTSMTNLTGLDWYTNTPISDNSTSVPANITKLQHLQSLCLLYWNFVDSPSIHHLMNLPRLTSLILNIGNNQVAERITELTTLEHLDICGNFDYTQEFFKSSLPNIRHLRVLGND